VIVPGRNELDLELGGTELGMLASRHRIDTVLHLANPRVYTSNSALGKSLTMLRNVLEVCATKDICLVYPSGWEVYSGYAGDLLADETLPLYPRGPYGDAKFLAELLIRKFEEQHGLKSAVFRSGPVYGAAADKPKFIYNFIDKARRSETIVTHRYLNGDPALDLLHVDDLIEGIVKICKLRYLGTLNLGTGATTTTRSIAELIKAELGSGSLIEQVQIVSHSARIAMNAEKARDVLEWQPTMSVQDGLRGLLRDKLEKDGL
jgi:UDP-glucuronate decarboxylase